MTMFVSYWMKYSQDQQASFYMTYGIPSAQGLGGLFWGSQLSMHSLDGEPRSRYLGVTSFCTSIRTDAYTSFLRLDPALP